MLDEPEQNCGKINWSMAIGLSVVVHIIVLGCFWMVSGPSAAKVDAGAGTVAQAQTTGNASPAEDGEVRPSTPEAQPLPARQPVAEATADYTVKPGDFPSRIARANGCTVADLKRLNGAVIDKTLHPGQVLKIPAK